MCHSRPAHSLSLPLGMHSLTPHSLRFHYSHSLYCELSVLGLFLTLTFNLVCASTGEQMVKMCHCTPLPPSLAAIALLYFDRTIFCDVDFIYAPYGFLFQVIFGFVFW